MHKFKLKDHVLTPQNKVAIILEIKAKSDNKYNSKGELIVNYLYGIKCDNYKFITHSIPEEWLRNKV